MSQPVVKAVIPAAGKGTRLLPLTKELPKEMLPVGRKPVIQYVAEEIGRAGITQAMIVTGMHKRSIEDQLDLCPSFLSLMEKEGDETDLRELKFLEEKVRFSFTRQSAALGLGHAVSLCAGFAGGDDFAVALGDTIIGIKEDEELLPRMIKFHRESGASAVIAVEEVAPSETSLYGIVDIRHSPGKAAAVADIVEKPAPGKAPTRLAVAARYIFSPCIFEALDKTQPGKNGELQLTDAIRILIKSGRQVYAWPLSVNQKRYDIGSFEGYFRAFIDFSLLDGRYGNIVREYIKNSACRV